MEQPKRVDFKTTEILGSDTDRCAIMHSPSRLFNQTSSHRSNGPEFRSARFETGTPALAAHAGID